MSSSASTPDQPEPKKKPSHLKTECPSCGNKTPKEEAQCPQCGLIYQKYKDPKQRAAEARLAALAEQSGGGLPNGVKVFLLVVIGIPALIFFVPEVGSRVLGVHFKYDVSKGDVFTHEGVMNVELGAKDFNQNFQPVLDYKIETASNRKVKESDSGGNTTYIVQPSYFNLVMNGKDYDVGVNSWAYNEAKGAHGQITTSLIDIAVSAGRAHAHMAKVQQQRIQRKMEREMGWAEELEEEPLAAPEPVVPVFNPVAGVARQHTAMLNHAADFVFPKKRLRPGDEWKQEVYWKLFAPHARVDTHHTLPFKVVGFERLKKGYAAIVEYNWNFSPSFTPIGPEMEAIFKKGPVQATYQGKAWIGYSDGILKKLDGQFEITINSINSNPEALASALGVETVPPSGDLVIRGTHKVQQK